MIGRETQHDEDGLSLDLEPPPLDELADKERQLDQEMWGVIGDALVARGIWALGLELSRGHVILRGWVRDQWTSSEIERIISNATPDVIIENEMRINSK